MKTPYAFVLIHFGDKVQYFELELYFFVNLRKFTDQNIIYLYSINDTPDIFIQHIRPLVSFCIPYDDNHITLNINFNSNYTLFNTLRTCNFIFAYNLIQYDKICLIESDMIIMKPIDHIFSLKTPSVFNYNTKHFTKNLRNNMNHIIINGGVILFKPSKKMFQLYIKNLHSIIQNNSPYPNEALFIATNKFSFNLPVFYNLSYHHLTDFYLHKMQLQPSDLIDKVVIYHYNETYKPTQIIKDKWYLHIDESQIKNIRRKIPILFYKTIYDEYFDKFNPIILSIQ